MTDQNQFPNENPTGFDADPTGDYQEYTGPTKADETKKTSLIKTQGLARRS